MDKSEEGINLKSLRLENFISVQKISEALNVSIQEVYRYEQGKRKIGLEQIPILSNLFGCSVSTIVKAALNSYLFDI